MCDQIHGATLKQNRRHIKYPGIKSQIVAGKSMGDASIRPIGPILHCLFWLYQSGLHRFLLGSLMLLPRSSF